MLSSVFGRLLAVVVACVLLGGGFALAAEPAGATDGAAPQLWHVSFTPPNVNITASDVVVAVKVVTTDLGGSGVASGCVEFYVPNFAIPYRGACFDSSNLIAGTAQSGTYEVDITFPRYAHDGFYEIDGISLKDAAGNQSFYDAFDLFLMNEPYGVTVTGVSDVTAPTLVSLAVSATTGDLADGDFTATVTAHITDAQSGYTGTCLEFGGPLFPTSDSASACLIDPVNRIAGTAQDGTYQATLTIPQTASPGVYPVLDYQLQDGARNFVNETAAQLESLGAPSAIVLTNSADTTPGAPTNVVATAGNVSASVAWTPPTSTGGAQLISYTVTADPGGQTVAVAGNKTSAIVPGLSNGTQYTFSVHATNGVGVGAESDASNAVTPEAQPGAPTAVQGVAGTGQVDLSWTPPANDGGSPILGYSIKQSGDCGPNGPLCATATAAADATSVTVAGLLNGTSYSFTVHATNAIGNGPESVASTAVTTTPGTATAPLFVSASAGSAQASLQWQAPANDGGSAITSYTVTASPGGLTMTVPVNSSNRTITGLTNGTHYTFTVHATNAYGDSPESTPSAAVYVYGGPDAPTAVHAVAGNGRATVSWTPPAFDGGAAIYEYEVVAMPSAVSINVAFPTTSVVLPGLTNGTAYTVTVTAVNQAGGGTESAPSNAVRVGVPAAPTSPHAVSGSTAGLTGSLSVSYVTGAANGSPITRFTATCTSSNGGVLKTGVHVGATAVPIVVTGVTTKKTYTCTVRATNARDAGPPTAPSASVIVGAPAAPTALHAVKVGAGKLNATFTPGAANGSPITGFTLTCVSTNGGAPKIQIGAASPVTVIGLGAGKTYRCTVKATNARGTGPPSVASAPVTV